MMRNSFIFEAALSVLCEVVSCFSLFSLRTVFNVPLFAHGLYSFYMNDLLAELQRKGTRRIPRRRRWLICMVDLDYMTTYFVPGLRLVTTEHVEETMTSFVLTAALPVPSREHL